MVGMHHERENMMRTLYKPAVEELLEGQGAEWKLPFSPVLEPIEGLSLWLVQSSFGSIKLEVSLVRNGKIVIPNSSLRQIYQMLGLEPQIFSEEFEVKLSCLMRSAEYTGWLSSGNGVAKRELVNRITGFNLGIPVQFISA
jgi:hypothetical protein